MSGNVVAEAFTLATADRVTPHDMRRALATHGPAVLGIKDEDTRKVLNHAAGGKDVTTRHYAFHESVPDKAAVLERWEGWLLKLMAEQLDGAGWPVFLPRTEVQAKGEVLVSVGYGDFCGNVPVGCCGGL